MLQELAFDDDQVRVEEVLYEMFLGLADRLTETGGAPTLTEALSEADPPGPEHVIV